MEEQPGGLKPQGWTPLPCAPPGISPDPEPSPALPRGLPVARPRLSLLCSHLPQPSSAISLLAPSLTLPMSGALSAGQAVNGTVYGTAGSTHLSPQVCLYHSLTPNSTPGLARWHPGPGLQGKDPPLRPALVLCRAKRARSRQRRAPRMMQMMMGNETLPLPAGRSRVGSAWQEDRKGSTRAGRGGGPGHTCPDPHYTGGRGPRGKSDGVALSLLGK